MKKIIYSTFILFLAIGFFSCEKEYETEGLSEITEYPVITINSTETVISLTLGENFTPPSAETSTGDPVDISNPVDVNTPGLYTVTYSATNVDGFTRTSSINVFVSGTQPLEGIYYGALTGVGGGGPIFIYATGTDTYHCSDLFAGYYEYHRGYGSTYRATGTLTKDGDNHYAISATSVWGDLTSAEGATVDENGTITYGMEFISDGYNWGGLKFYLEKAN